jgi:hypothetical protein
MDEAFCLFYTLKIISDATLEFYMSFVESRWAGTVELKRYGVVLNPMSGDASPWYWMVCFRVFAPFELEMCGQESLG